MPSEIIPSLDLAPSVPSRIVTITASDVTKGTPRAGATVTFRLRGDLRVPADGAIISAGSVTLTLDAEGKGRVRLPCYTDDTRADSADGGWYLEVSKSWVGQTDLIRVPTGSTPIALAAIEPVREIPLHQAPSWLVTGAGVEIVEGAQWDATVVVDGGVARFRFTVPPGGEAWVKGRLQPPADIDSMRASEQSGVYRILTAEDATALGLPENEPGLLTVQSLGGGSSSSAIQMFEARSQRTWTRTVAGGSGATWTEWVETSATTAVRDRGSLSDANLDTVILPGVYQQEDVARAHRRNNYPVTSHGSLEVTAVDDDIRIQRFTATPSGQVFIRELADGQWSAWVEASVPESLTTWAGQYESQQAYPVNSMVRADGSLWVKRTAPATEVSERTNHVRNPRFRNNAAGWTLGAGWSGTLSDDRRIITASRDQVAGNNIMSQPTGQGPVIATREEPVSVAIRVTVPASSPTAGSFQVAVQFSTTYRTGESVTIQPGQARTLTATGYAPVTDIEARLRVITGADGIPEGTEFHLDQPLMELAEHTGIFFHGSTPDTVTAEHSWIGAQDDSPSRRLEEVSIPDSAPGVGDEWELVITASGTESTREPLQPKGTVVETVAANEVPATLDRTRTVGFSQGGPDLRQTWDGGHTWQDVHQFPSSDIELVRQLANGELLVVNTQSTIRRVHLSSGFSIADPEAATWTTVLDGIHPGVQFSPGWSFYTHENIVLLAEYGPKEGGWMGFHPEPGEWARYLWLSVDYGRTWKTVFDLGDYLDSQNYPDHVQMHLHGVAWDPWWDRIWLSFGDAADGIVFSDDLGETWHTALFDPEYHTRTQVVGIAPMPTCILFGGDAGISGVLRIDRAQGKHTGPYATTEAYLPEEGSYLCRSIQRVDRVGDDAPLFIGFGSEITEARSYVLATWDGWSFVKVWQDPDLQPAGRGTRSVVGPTVQGKVIIGSNDEKVPGMWSRITMPAPGY